jgi:DNA replication protein DnaC
MMTNPTLSKLQDMRLIGMVKAFEEQIAMPDIGQMTFEDRFGLIIDREEIERRNRKFKTRIRKAKPKESACVEDITFSSARGIDKKTVLSLANCEWIRHQQNIIISGPTGVGKTYLACALLHSACREGFTAKYLRVPRFLRQLSAAKLDGSYDKLMKDLARTDVILFDDLGLSKMSGEESRDLLEIMEDRHAQKSSILTSQLDSEKWYDLIPDPTIADALLDRIIHRSHKIKLKGGSLRKTNSGLTEGEECFN